MVMLHQLRSGDIVRIVAFMENDYFKDEFISKGIREGSIIRIVSSYGLITFSYNSKIFSVSKGYAENVRVVKVVAIHIKNGDLDD